MSWREHAACAGKDNDLFFVKSGGTHAARLICVSCPVTDECLAYAIDNKIIDGVWGGLGPDQRRAVKRGKVVSGEYVAPGRKQLTYTECLFGDSSRCGTRWGYTKGCRAEHCVGAERQKSREQRQRKKAQAHAHQAEHGHPEVERIS